MEGKVVKIVKELIKVLLNGSLMGQNQYEI